MVTAAVVVVVVVVDFEVPDTIMSWIGTGIG